MTIREFIKILKKYGEDRELLYANDEELNQIYTGFEVADLDTTGKVIMFPLSGAEYEVEYSHGDTFCPNFGEPVLPNEAGRCSLCNAKLEPEEE
jgi:hypothetical protein